MGPSRSELKSGQYSLRGVEKKHSLGKTREPIWDEGQGCAEITYRPKVKLVNVRHRD